MSTKRDILKNLLTGQTDIAEAKRQYVNGRFLLATIEGDRVRLSENGFPKGVVTLSEFEAMDLRFYGSVLVDDIRSGANRKFGSAIVLSKADLESDPLE